MRNEQMYKSFLKEGESELSKFVKYKMLKPTIGYDVNTSHEVIGKFASLYELGNNVAPRIGAKYKFQIDSSESDAYIKYWKELRGDTMNAAWIPLKYYFKQCDKLSEVLNGKKGNLTIPQDKLSHGFHNESWFTYILENIEQFENIITDEINEFLKYHHHIGNFMLVPQDGGLNSGRSNFGKWDSWDLTLLTIHEFFKNNIDVNDPFVLDEKLNISKSGEIKFLNNIQAKTWLASFGTWENFLELNYLQDYVDDNLTPILLFKEHSFVKPLPTTEEEFVDYFKNTTELIKARTNRMK